MNEIVLSNGVRLPQIGMGTWQINDRKMLRELIKSAYECGYYMIDTAAAYSNETGIGKALEALSADRKNWILCDKVWNTFRGYDKVKEACKKSLKKLKTDYLDLYLIHWPASLKLYTNAEEINADTWRGMEALYREGFVRAIGVCNFKIHHLKELEKTAEIRPMVNQIEFHPGMLSQELVFYCQKAGICVEASSPLGNGQILKNEVVQRIARSRQRSSAQICLRFAIERGLIVIPKTISMERLHENIDVSDFCLTEKEMLAIDKIPYCGGIGIDSDEVIEFG